MARLACRTGAVCPGPRPHTESGEQARAHGERRGDGDHNAEQELSAKQKALGEVGRTRISTLQFR